MSENIIATQSAADVIAQLKSQGPSKYDTDRKEVLASITKAGNFVPYIQLMGSNSEKVQTGAFPLAHFAYVQNKEHHDLTKSFICLILAWRSKAMIYKPEVKSYFDFKSAVFKEVQEAAKVPNSNRGFGPEFLLWLPEHKIVATYFFGNITHRMEAGNLVQCADNGSRICRINSILIENKKTGTRWYGPKMEKYDLEIEMPNLADLAGVIKTFLNPPDQVEETPAGEEGTDRG